MRMESVSHGGHSIDIDRNALIASLVPASPGPMSAAGNNDDVRRRKKIEVDETSLDDDEAKSYRGTTLFLVSPYPA
uniref:Uncharacterized protein n=1 Tax=Vespula pensylvanica TaxID=30213 RepID=A0A834UDF9_VESPE|nr:hypothetical protein H0235_005228 [Vespula pensylvanica]